MAINVELGIKNLRDIAKSMHALADAMESRGVHSFSGNLEFTAYHGDTESLEAISFHGIPRKPDGNTVVTVIGDLTVTLASPHKK